MRDDVNDDLRSVGIKSSQAGRYLVRNVFLSKNIGPQERQLELGGKPNHLLIKGFQSVDRKEAEV